MTEQNSIQDLITTDFFITAKLLSDNPFMIERLILELSVYRTFITKQNLLEEFKEFEHLYTIENNIRKENNE